MAQDLVNQLVDTVAIKNQLSEVKRDLKSLGEAAEEQARKMAGLYGEMKKAGTFPELRKASEAHRAAVKELTAEIKEKERQERLVLDLEARLAQAESDNAKAIVRTRLELAEKNREMKREAEAQLAAKKTSDDYLNSIKGQAKSINDLTEQNKQLRAARDAMNTETQAEEIQKLNTIIDANTAVIQLNQDKYVQQKPNGGRA